MGKTRLTYDPTAARAIYRYLVEQGYARQLNVGFRELDYQDPSDPIGSIRHKGRKTVYQEIWENGLEILDRLGKRAEWEEDTSQATTPDHKKAIEDYQKLRRLIECRMQRPIPWTFEAPYICPDPLQEEKAFQNPNKLIQAKKIRAKVRRAIGKLNQLLAENEKRNSKQYQQRLTVGLYWFTWIFENPREVIPLPVEALLKFSRGDPLIRSTFSITEKILTGFGERLLGEHLPGRTADEGAIEYLRSDESGRSP